LGAYLVSSLGIQEGWTSSYSLIDG